MPPWGVETPVELAGRRTTHHIRSLHGRGTRDAYKRLRAEGHGDCLDTVFQFPGYRIFAHRRVVWAKWEREMAQQATNALHVSNQHNSDREKLHPVDLEVGRRIRVRRLQLRMSQVALGSGVGISFQQIQKYETGVNRVSSSALYEIAEVLDVPVAYFFETLPPPGKGNSQHYIAKADARIDFVATSEGQRLVDAFLGLPRRARSKLIALIAAFGNPDI